MCSGLPTTCLKSHHPRPGGDGAPPPNTAGNWISLVTGRMLDLTLLGSLHNILSLGGLREEGPRLGSPIT